MINYYKLLQTTEQKPTRCDFLQPIWNLDLENCCPHMSRGEANSHAVPTNGMNKGRSKWHPIWKPTTGEMQSIYVCSTLINHGIGIFLKSRPVVLSVMSRQNSKRMPSSSVSQQNHQLPELPDDLHHGWLPTIEDQSYRPWKLESLYKFKDHWMLRNVLNFFGRILCIRS